MVVRIRFKRMGVKNNFFYRIVVVDLRILRDGKIIDEIGYYNFLKNFVDIKVDVEKVKKWLLYGV